LVLDVLGLSAGAARVRAGRRDGANVACRGTSTAAYAHQALALRPAQGEPPARNVFVAVRAGAERDPVLTAVREELRTAAAFVAAAGVR
ncbi:hypothetical protein AB0J04_40505, partial [Streptomyces sp. NPDC050263]